MAWLICLRGMRGFRLRCDRLSDLQPQQRTRYYHYRYDMMIDRARQDHTGCTEIVFQEPYSFARAREKSSFPVSTTKHPSMIAEIGRDDDHVI